MNRVAQFYRELVARLSERLRNGERDLDALLNSVSQKVVQSGKLTSGEMDQITGAIRRDYEALMRGDEENRQPFSDSVFMRVIKENVWKELTDITDKTQLEWREMFEDLNHHGVWLSGEVAGPGNMVCEKCHHYQALYTPDVLARCVKCGHDQFQRRPFEP